MSYRHSSYRKLRRAAARAGAHPHPARRTDTARIAHWIGIGVLAKPEGWGKSRRAE